MTEEKSPRRGENRIYRLIDRGPMVLGVPIIHAFVLGGAMGFGYWPAKIMFGQAIGLTWIACGCVVWFCMGFVNAKDKTYLPRLFLRLSGIVMKERITSYVPSDQQIEIV